MQTESVRAHKSAQSGHGEMRLAREKFEERCGPPPRGSFMPLKGSATITGVAFFDVKHTNPQHGVAEQR
jgi:hypothetical protein